MRKFAVILLSIIAQICVSSCVMNEQVAEDKRMPDISTEILETVTDTETDDIRDDISSLAQKVELMDEEEYSWKRTDKTEYVVLHFTSAVVNHRDDPYNLQYVRNSFEETYVSINYIIDRDGTIHCWLPESRAAWHAGVGTLAVDERLTNRMNKFSIGIEMLAIGSEKDMSQYLTAEEYAALDDNLKGYTDKQYESLKLLVADICKRQGIPFDKDHVIGHDMYNPAKTDPGELFDWSRLFEQ